MFYIYLVLDLCTDNLQVYLKLVCAVVVGRKVVCLCKIRRSPEWGETVAAIK